MEGHAVSVQRRLSSARLFSKGEPLPLMSASPTVQRVPGRGLFLC